MRKLAENVWLYPFALTLLGMNLGRNVTVVRLHSGKLVIHSTAPFATADVAEIKEAGEPGWLVEGMIDHDTFSNEGRKAFPGIPFLAPHGFQGRVDFEVADLDTPPAEWMPELEVIPIAGAPKMAESTLFHHPSGTLIVCDLLFHFPGPETLWEKFLLSVALGGEKAPGFSRRVKLAVKDRSAFGESLGKILSLPIQRIIPGHGAVLEKDAKERARMLFSNNGYP